MKVRTICMALAISAVLCGCSWMNGSYVSVTPHHEQLSGVQSGSLSVSEYTELRNLLAELTEAGVESAVIHVAEYDRTTLEEGMVNAVRYITEILPIGAYAIDKVVYEIGSNAGQPAILVNITYLHGRSELRRIRNVTDMDAAAVIIKDALADCSDSVVINVQNYEDVDLVQMVADYAAQNPNVVMEIPAVAIGAYPEQGIRRVLELKFTYQTSRESLRSMQEQVRRVFASAALYINQNATETQKFAQLYTFLTERSPEYKIETSITPAYSLLNHGVGDSRAFATVYAAMCRSVGLDCQTVSGTRNGEAWYWNLICDNGVYYHTDLLSESPDGGLQKLSDGDMDGYVWDYSAYPEAGVPAVFVGATE